jgi:uncharacterized protein (DUF58 family)
MSLEGLAPPAARQGPGALPEDAVARIEPALRKRMAGLLPGEHPAAGAADGLELVQLRAYEPGDDVRRLDAAASARTGVPHVRLQVPERAVVTWLVLDVSASMAFGSQGRLKSDVTEGVAEVCARLAVRRGGRVAAALAGAPQSHELAPSGGRGALGAVTAMVRRGVAADGTAGVPLADALRRVARLATTRAAVIVVSDFREGGARDAGVEAGDDATAPAPRRAIFAGRRRAAARPGWAAALSALGARHAVLAVEVVDPFEAELPDAGLLTFRDPERGDLVEVDTGDARVRDAYAAAERKRREDVAAALRRTGARHVVLSTDADWLRELGRVA